MENRKEKQKEKNFNKQRNYKIERYGNNAVATENRKEEQKTNEFL